MITDMFSDKDSQVIVEYVRTLLNNLDYDPIFADGAIITDYGLAKIEYHELLRNNGYIH